LASVIALRLVGFKRWWRFLNATIGSRKLAYPGLDTEVAEYCASVVDMVARNAPWGLVTCLPRSLTLWWLLRRNGLACELKIGVQRDGERMRAHAWVDYYGTAIGDAGHERFLSFDSKTLAA